jgi:hypothetical protein
MSSICEIIGRGRQIDHHAQSSLGAVFECNATLHCRSQFSHDRKPKTGPSRALIPRWIDARERLTKLA